MAGMVAAAPDPGVLRVRELEVAGKRLTWANLFAVNDRESMIVGLDRLAAFRTGDTTMVGILNNRADRERRALQFADIAARDLDFDRLVTFGAYESAVTGRLLRNGFDGGRILNLGDDRKPSIGTILQECVADMPTTHVLLVGFVNIHTAQAEALMEYLEHTAPAAATAPAAESGAGAAEERVRAVGRMRPQRRHRAVAQLRTRRPRLAGRFRSQRWALRAGHTRPLRDAQPGTRMRPQRRPQAQTRVLPALAPGRMRPQHAAVALERELEMAA